MIRFCSANCQTKNADKIIKSVESFFRIKEGDSNRKFSLKRMSCVGRCLEGPVIRLNGTIYTKTTSDKAIKLIQEYLGLDY